MKKKKSKAFKTSWKLIQMKFIKHKVSFTKYMNFLYSSQHVLCYNIGAF